MRAIRRIITMVLLTGFVAFIFLYEIGYLLVKPGNTEDLRNLIEVEEVIYEDEGRLYMVTVTQQRATLFWALVGLLHPHIELRRVRDVLPPDMDQEEYRELLQQMMDESQLMSKYIALKKAGYEVEIVSEGAAVAGFVEDSPAKGILKEEDVIIKVDGEEVQVADEVISKVQARSIGDPVIITVLRDQNSQDLEIFTAPHPDDPALPALGVLIRTLGWDAVLPFDINMRTGRIGGPSAGLMFVLEIINQLDPVDITGGRLIAGTGTIDVDEKVGRIGGVYQKVIAAENAGAEFFIVPRANYQEAQKAARRIELVPVSTLDDALEFLDKLRQDSALILEQPLLFSRRAA